MNQSTYFENHDKGHIKQNIDVIFISKNDLDFSCLLKLKLYLIKLKFVLAAVKHASRNKFITKHLAVVNLITTDIIRIFSAFG